MDQDSTQLKRELKLDANMIKTIIFSLLLLCSIESKANTVCHRCFTYDKHPSYLLKQNDSSNYKIKILDVDINYSQLRFTIVDEKNNPLDGVITLMDGNKKGMSSVMLNNDGKISMMVNGNNVKYIVVARIGFGTIVIPYEKVKNKIVEIKVQLYPFTTTN